MKNNLSQKCNKFVYKYIVANSSNEAENTYLYTNEHYLNATEIAKLLGLYNKGKPDARVIGRIAKLALPEYPKTYYVTARQYHMRVYRDQEIISIINYLIKEGEKRECALVTKIQS